MNKPKIAKNHFIGIIWRNRNAKTGLAITPLPIAVLPTPTRYNILIIAGFKHFCPRRPCINGFINQRCGQHIIFTTYINSINIIFCHADIHHEVIRKIHTIRLTYPRVCPCRRVIEGVNSFSKLIIIPWHNAVICTC